MKYCEGCRSRDRHCNIRIYMRFAMEEATSNVSKCPCGICLVKGICKCPCEEYLSFSIVEH